MRVLLKRILCATDFSDFSNHAIPYGIALGLGGLWAFPQSALGLWVIERLVGQ